MIWLKLGFDITWMDRWDESKPIGVGLWMINDQIDHRRSMLLIVSGMIRSLIYDHIAKWMLLSLDYLYLLSDFQTALSSDDWYVPPKLASWELLLVLICEYWRWYLVLDLFMLSSNLAFPDCIALLCKGIFSSSKQVNLYWPLTSPA